MSFDCLQKAKGDATRDELIKKLFISSVRLLCKPTSWSEKGHVIKVPFMHMHIYPVLAGLLPRAHWLFMYRDGLKVCMCACCFTYSTLALVLPMPYVDNTVCIVK